MDAYILYMNICMYLCLHEFIHVCMYACVHIFTHAYIKASVLVCMYACMYDYMNIYVWREADRKFEEIRPVQCLQALASVMEDSLALSRPVYTNVYI